MRIGRLAAGFAGTAALALAPAAIAPTTASAAPTSTTYTTVGANTWTVPDGVTCVSVDAIGAAGGGFVGAEADAASSFNGGGGVGAAATNQLGGEAVSTIPVLAGQNLQINVGGRGGDGADSSTATVPGGAGGFNGGGAGGAGLATSPDNSLWAGGGGGGGASDVRQLGTGLVNRVVVAGGGGGTGPNANSGGDGGDPASDGSGGSLAGKGATSSAAGLGGTSAGGSTNGQAGALGVGGAGAEATDINLGGGGGGGGLYGGGGGGGAAPGMGLGGGGGGGSSLGNTLTTGVDAGNGGNGKVTLSYTAGDTSCLRAPLTIKKVTTGAAATPGQQFTMHVACADGHLDGRSFGVDGAMSSADLTFTVDSSGVVQPASGYVVGFVNPDTCTVSETGNGGATETSFACSGSGAAEQIRGESTWDGQAGAATAANPDDPCQTSGPQSTPMGVDIVARGQEATVTVTNTLVVPAAAQVIQPHFTG